jgi:parallel beta-helix repeat protein
MQADGMTHKSLIVFMTILLALSSFYMGIDIGKGEEPVQPKFYVDDDYNSTDPRWQIDHFDSIGDAIAKSSAGDWIKVLAGTYYETLIIPHKLDIFGEGRDITIIDGNNSGDVITINAQDVNISHFTIRDSGATNSLININSANTIITDNKLTMGNYGIKISDCNYNTIYDNIITNNNGTGISLNNSDYNSITFNTITKNKNGLFLFNSDHNNIEDNDAIKTNNVNGVFLNETSNYNTIEDNNISSNKENGIFLSDRCDNNEILDNEIHLNENSGIRVENSSSNTFNSNTVQSNKNYGMMIGGSNNDIQENTIKSNSEHGIFLFADDLTTVYDNLLTDNTKCGLQLYYSTNATISKNEISENLQYGINLDFQCRDNLIYNNYFHHNNENSIDKSINNNTWNITKTSGTNIVGGSYLSGNYWDDYDEVSEGAIDDGDGIAVDSYIIYNSNKDKGALLDVTPPEITAHNPSPATQTLGGYTYISATVTDNVEIKQVNLIVLDPNGATSNISIVGNKTGTTYYCDKIFSTVGNYSYYIAAKDPRNWVTTETSNPQNFIIDQGIGPTITDNSPTTGSPSAWFVFNATVTDDADDAEFLEVIVDWSHGDESNSTELKIDSGNYFREGIKLDNSIKSLKYKITATDRWGQSSTTDLTTVTITDEDPPSISIRKRNYSSDGVINTFTIGADITDNHTLSKVQIEYWYGDTSHKTADMDNKGDSYYEKLIQIDSEISRVYCIINATDPSGNSANTKNPFANASGPYYGVNGIDVEFNGTNSFDLDGDIISYSWNFGDGTTGTADLAQHAYSANGTYTISLTVKDNDGNNDTDTTYVKITETKKINTSLNILTKINEEYDLDLTEFFYGYDTNGDDIPDVFVDPNNVLKAVHSGSININDDAVFLISVDDSNKPEFMWNITTDEIIDIKNIDGKSEESANIDKTNKIVTQNIVINKTSGWIYISVEDPLIGESGEIEDIISVTKKDIEIDSDKIIRKNGVTYVLDDPETSYQFKYSFEPPTLNSGVFKPASGGTIDKNNQTIVISYNVPVTIIDAAFYMIDPLTTLPIDDGTSIDIKNLLTTKNDKDFSYTPPNNLEEGRYEIYLFVRQKNGTKTKEDTSRYYYKPYAQEESAISLSLMWIILGGILISFIAIFALMKYKNIGVESFIYIKNKKILPFFKPLIFGPLSIDVNDDKVSKAEFYLNGKLKDTLTKSPYVWKYDNPMFLKQTIETKVYDEKGNSTSSGEMTFYVFNPPHLFK